MAEWYVMTTPEFLSLASGAGIRNYVFLGEEEIPVPDRQEQIRLAFQLVKKGFVSIEQKDDEKEEYVLKEDLKELMQIVGDAERVLTVRYRGSSAPVYCVYGSGSRYACMETMASSDVSVRFGGGSEEEILERILLPEELPIELFEALPEMEEAVRRGVYTAVPGKTGKLPADGSVYAVWEMLQAKSGKAATRIIIRREKAEMHLIRETILAEDAEQVKISREIYLYSEKQLHSQLKKLMEEWE
ncbi:MAG: hypothetical protein Q4B22_09560 [Eubacteriales bacterium]|nr:hypothetical protein [Eubacteriales bacterium]